MRTCTWHVTFYVKPTTEDNMNDTAHNYDDTCTCPPCCEERDIREGEAVDPQACSHSYNGHGMNPLADHHSRAALIEWLTWNDPNGIYTDRDNEAEGYPPMTRTELQLTALSQLEG